MNLHYNHLGNFSRYYYQNFHGIINCYDNFIDIIDYYPEERLIDIPAIIEIISRFHIFGDRTLIKGLSKSPWMAKIENNEWDYYELPKHGNNDINESVVADQLYSLLMEETLEYIEGKQNIGILLSGGMDSRIAAGILAKIKEEYRPNIKIIAITWGIENSRDVKYAQQIVKEMGWEWVYYPLSAEGLLSNITETAIQGCEFSPIHLHAIPQIKNNLGVDCIIAASFGDSVGRAEYSGKHILKLIQINKYMHNWFSLIKTQQFNDNIHQTFLDIEKYRKLFPRDKKYQEYEIERQAHYMRRMLNPCIASLNYKIPTYQLFSHPKVYSYIWSIRPERRNDYIYSHILEKMDIRIQNLPWARTGEKYLDNYGDGDNYSDLNNLYGKWVRNDLSDQIKKMVLSSSIQKLNLFNLDALQLCCSLNNKLFKKNRASKIDEILLWICSLSKFIELYEVKCTYDQSPFRLIDKMKGKIACPMELASYAILYNYRNR